MQYINLNRRCSGLDYWLWARSIIQPYNVHSIHWFNVQSRFLNGIVGMVSTQFHYCNPNDGFLGTETTVYIVNNVFLP